MGGVGTSIIGRPRRLPSRHPHASRYTLDCEEPVKASTLSRARRFTHNRDATSRRARDGGDDARPLCVRFASPWRDVSRGAHPGQDEGERLMERPGVITAEGAQRARSPYRGNPSRTFWRSAVTGRTVETLDSLYSKKFEIGADDRIATAGSCFAQHIARNMRANGYSVIDTEPAPPWMGAQTAAAYGFGVYSARFGNLYYMRQLLQLAREAMQGEEPQDVIWVKGDRFFDALRPSVEPQGHASPELVVEHRRQHIERVRAMFEQVDVFVYTLGLTEGWVSTEFGTAYPTAPGTIAGDFDPDRYAFKNFTFTEILQDFLAFRILLREVRPNVRFLLTVSPVSLAATATGEHVLKATVYSKSVLRAVAGELADTYDDVDYFPSYEIIAGPATDGRFFDETRRDVTAEGVAHVMSAFFAQHPKRHDATAERTVDAEDIEGVMCEDVLLEAFGE